MLLQQKCYVEGAQVLGLYAAQLIDRHLDPDPDVRNDSALLLELLTPIIKAWSSDWCLKANELAIQILGGYGYTREFPVEQNYRDNRINAIHEGTNGIQALDLLGRKAMMQNGAAVKVLFERIAATCAQAAGVEELAPLVTQLRAGIAIAAECTAAAGKRMAAGQVRQTLANAQHYMTVLGHLTIAWTWLWQALVAQRALAAQQEVDSQQASPNAANGDADFYRGKLQACRFFFATELPVIEHAARLVREVDSTAFDMRGEWF
jgi:butyryl-CoA dehydrogenase